MLCQVGGYGVDLVVCDAVGGLAAGPTAVAGAKRSAGADLGQVPPVPTLIDADMDGGTGGGSDLCRVAGHGIGFAVFFCGDLVRCFAVWCVCHDIILSSAPCGGVFCCGRFLGAAYPPEEGKQPIRYGAPGTLPPDRLWRSVGVCRAVAFVVPIVYHDLLPLSRAFAKFLKKILVGVVRQLLPGGGDCARIYGRSSAGGDFAVVGGCDMISYGYGG